jgi:hypothetical protein
MLDYKAVGRTPSGIRLTRNGREISAIRAPLGRVRVAGRAVRIADSAWVADVPPLPVRVADGEYDVFAYRWLHRGGDVNVCAVVRFRPPRLMVVTRRLAIHTDFRPDLTEGVIVDTGEITILSGNAITLESGLGDGYYPVVANLNYGRALQSLVVDFKLWECGKTILPSGWRSDEYGMAVPPDDA